MSTAFHFDEQNKAFFYEYIIKQGDILSQVCLNHGHEDWLSIYNHEKNSEFRSEVPDPNTIPIGNDVPKFYIPVLGSDVNSLGPDVPKAVLAHISFEDNSLFLQELDLINSNQGWIETKSRPEANGSIIFQNDSNDMYSLHSLKYELIFSDFYAEFSTIKQYVTGEGNFTHGALAPGSKAPFLKNEPRNLIAIPIYFIQCPSCGFDYKIVRKQGDNTTILCTHDQYPLNGLLDLITSEPDSFLEFTADLYAPSPISAPFNIKCRGKTRMNGAYGSFDVYWDESRFAQPDGENYALCNASEEQPKSVEVIGRRTWGAQNPIIDDDRSYSFHSTSKGVEVGGTPSPPYVNSGIPNNQFIPLKNVLKWITIHHTTDSAQSSSETVRDLQSKHQDTNLLPGGIGGSPAADIGYHFVIDANGAVYEGRPLGIKGSHAELFNGGNIGVVLAGQFESTDHFPDSPTSPTSEAIESMKKLVDILAARFHITSVAAHKVRKAQVNAGDTECPGDLLIPEVTRLTEKYPTDFDVFTPVDSINQRKHFIHQSSPNIHDPFHILILCDGFTVNEEDKFYEICETLKKELFEISPFAFCQRYINIFAFFTPSKVSGIPTSTSPETPETETRFSSRIEGNALKVKDEKKLLEFTVDKILFKLNGKTISGSEVWRNHYSKSYGAVAVMMNTNEGSAGAFEALWSGGVPLGKYFTFNIKGYDPNLTSQPGPFQHVFVHELGHAIHGFTDLPNGQKSSQKAPLADEYSEFDEEYSGLEPLEPNVTKFETILTGTSPEDPIDFEKIKWKKLIQPSRKSDIETKDPKRVIFFGDFESVQNRKENDEELVEGGHRHSRHVFRSSLTCKMKDSSMHHDFCKVCEQHVLETITGKKDHLIGRPSPYIVEEYIQEKKLFQEVFSITGLPNLQSLDEYSAKATATIAFLLNQSSLKLPFESFTYSIFDGHTHLRYGPLIIDPSFYQFYFNPTTDQFEYYRNDVVVKLPIPPTDEGIQFTDGFLGDFQELLLHLLDYQPVKEDWSTSSVDPVYIFSEELEMNIRLQFDRAGYEIIQTDPIRLNAQNLPLATTLETELQNALQPTP